MKIGSCSKGSTDMKEKLRSSLGKVTFELTIVTLGVLIALVINEWFQNYQEERRAHEILEKAHYEMKSNLVSLKSALKGYEKSIAYIDKLIEEDQKTANKNYLFSIPQEDLSVSVWRFALLRDELRELPVELLVRIESSYEATKHVKNTMEKMGPSFLTEFINKFTVSEDQTQLLKSLKHELKNALLRTKIAAFKQEIIIKETEYFLNTGQIKIEQFKQELNFAI
ncbi:hypothetical protein [Pseudoalteromonas phenolica]|uniref:hypothetical protein n=1 Tax=Pseudoalteromonas phenolica TaxID=161398 RepID=UPI00110BDE55|nr:hypothetical protein [Pseudoalteromonas phenolica]TMO53539.1 hypothetical protein CWC21_19280 [Pseudoalteromonas phenolica]